MIPAEPAITVRGNRGLQGHVDSHAGMRAAGWVTMIAGALVGTVLVLQSKEDCGQSTQFCLPTHPYMIHGLVVTTVAGLAGLVMVLQKDQAHVE